MATRWSRVRVLLLAALLAGALLPARSLTADDPPPPDLAALARRLDDPGSRWFALWEIGELGPAAAPLVPRVAAVLQGGHEVARRLAAEALGKIGAADPAAAAALLKVLPRARGGLEDAVLRALEQLEVGVAFRGALPEPITYASTPDLRALQQAYERKIVRADEVEWLRGCRAEAEAHARRLLEDRLFRLGEQAAANVGTSLQGVRGLGFVTRWSPPFLIVGLHASLPPAPAAGLQASVSSLRPDTERTAALEQHLQDAAGICQTVYRRILAHHGAPHDLRPLEDAFGGRPELPVAVRSFADGFPLTVWVAEPDGLSLWARARDRSEPPLYTDVVAELRTGHIVIALRREGEALGLPPPERVAWGVAAGLLRPFLRQRNAWKLRYPSYDWLEAALGVLWASPEPGAAGAEARTAEPLLLDSLAGVLRRGSGGRWPPAAGALLGRPLGRFLADESAQTWEIATEAGMDYRLGPPLYRVQAASLAEFLRYHASPERRAQFKALVEAWLTGSADAGNVRRILRLRDEDDEAALDAEFQTWWRARLELPVVDPQPAGPR